MLIVFNKNLMLELLTNDVWRKKNKLGPRAIIAIPTIFKHKVYDVINLDGTILVPRASYPSHTDWAYLKEKAPWGRGWDGTTVSFKSFCFTKTPFNVGKN